MSEISASDPKEVAPLQEVTLPSETSKALGIGLKKILGPSMTTITTGLATIPADEDLKPDIESGHSEMTSILDKLTTSKSVKVVPFSPGYELKFSDDHDETPLTPASHIKIDEQTTQKLGAAIRHHFNNANGLVLGFSDLIGADTITNAASEIRDKINIFNNAKEIHLTVNGPEDVNITVIPLEPKTSS